jgi:SAM-dependent methyltransferase
MGDKPRRFYDDTLGTEVYDPMSAAITASGPLSGDVDFYRRLAANQGGPILDVGCGTGRVAVALAADGFDVVGVDLSASMLRLAERRRAGLPAQVTARLTFTQGDMTSLDLGRRFRLIIAPSRVFQFMLTTASQRSALRSLKAHLEPAGRLVLDLFDPLLDFVVPGAPFPPRGGEVVHPVTENRVTWEVTDRIPDPARQLVDEGWTYREHGPSGEVLREETERLTLRWTTRSEMRLLYELEELDVVAEYGDFKGSPPTYGREQVWVLRRAGDA